MGDLKRDTPVATFYVIRGGWCRYGNYVVSYEGYGSFLQSRKLTPTVS